ncbi:Clp protease N-terminal domain-containing protein [Dactylosporangium sp. NPDC051541]|uniref:Clp protease N-terminal domain-containing protein n=1 Tax=Dactylosporangium sp. NPDC051541 TaxID=3363977 RepID=UPI0037A673D5
MFRGDHADLHRAVNGALVQARALGHPRTGSEHLLLSLSASTHPVATILHRYGAAEAALHPAVCAAAPLGAGAAADRETLAPLAIDVDRFLAGLTPSVLDRPPAREPRLPFGAAKARRHCARLNPPLGLDSQAAIEASLRLALARRERDHRPEHLALTLVALDPGAAWTLRTAGVDARALLAALRAAFPPPNRNALLRADRHLGRRSRARDVIRRYQHTTGRAVTTPAALPALIV